MRARFRIRYCLPDFISLLPFSYKRWQMIRKLCITSQGYTRCVAALAVQVPRDLHLLSSSPIHSDLVELAILSHHTTKLILSTSYRTPFDFPACSPHQPMVS